MGTYLWLDNSRAEPREYIRSAPTVVVKEVDIERPAEAVFAFATTPAHWMRWRPATVSVEGGQRPLLRGETVVEHIDGVRRAVVTWKVVECVAPQVWVIEGRTHDGRARLTYRFQRTPRGTHVEYVLAYQLRSRLWQWLNWRLIAPRLNDDSAQALDNLRRVLEG